MKTATAAATTAMIVTITKMDILMLVLVLLWISIMGFYERLQDFCLRNQSLDNILSTALLLGR